MKRMDNKQISKKIEVVVSNNEPLIKLIRSLKLTPIWSGVIFCFIFSLSLTVAGCLVKGDPDVEKYLSYPWNISWSVSMLFLFPPIVGLTLKYYNEIPLLFKKLSRGIENKEQNLYKQFIQEMNMRFNSWAIPAIALSASLVLNYIYYKQIFSHPPYSSWIKNGDILSGLLGSTSGFTWPGLYSAIIQIILTYWIINLLWNSFVFAWGLHCFFNKYEFNISIKPLHADKCCGLKIIGQVGNYFNYIIFLIGLYLSLKVIDKIVLQNLSLSSDIGNPILLACYGVLAPLLFFLPLAAAHKRMKNKKDEILEQMSNSLSPLFDKTVEAPSEQLCNETEKIIKYIEFINRKIPIWPFNFKSLRSFFGAIITPVLPVVLPFLIQWIVELVGSLS